MSAAKEIGRPAKAAATDDKSAVTDKTEFTQQEIAELDARPFFFRHVTKIVKFFAVILLAGMWACTVFSIRHRKEDLDNYSPWYCLTVSIVITLLEIVWFFSNCICCKDDGGCCCTCWRILMWVDDWKKGILYIALAVPAFIKSNLLAIGCGVLIIVIGFLYIMKSFAACPCIGGKKFVVRGKRDEEKKKSQRPADEESPVLPSRPAPRY